MMMHSALSSRHRRWFSIAVRSRGRSYYLAGAVMELQEHDGFVTALVAGTSVYEVLLHTDQDDDPGECSCEAFRKFGPCKHMWAVILAFEDADIELEEGFDSGADLHFNSRPSWETRLEGLRRERSVRTRDPWVPLEGEDVRLEYVLERHHVSDRHRPRIRTLLRKRLKSGEWGKAREINVARSDRSFPREDRELLGLFGVDRDSYHSPIDYYSGAGFSLTAEQAEAILPRVAGTGRFFVLADGAEPQPVTMDAGEPWVFCVQLVRSTKDLSVVGELRRGDETLPVDDVVALIGSRLFVAGGALHRLDARGAIAWLVELHGRGEMRVPFTAEADVRRELLQLPASTTSNAEMLPAPEKGEPIPHLFVEPVRSRVQNARVISHVAFDYGTGRRIEPDDPRDFVGDEQGERNVSRDLAAEREHLAFYLSLGARRTAEDRLYGTHGTIPVRRLTEIVRALMGRGWTIEAEGRPYRQAGGTSVSVRTGIDWFELEGGLEFGDQVAPLPELLRAAREGRSDVQLGDGSVGILPDEWLKSWGLIELADSVQGDSLRFQTQQGWLLDVLLAEREGVEADAGFERYRAELAKFRGVKPRSAPRGFRGELRPYQRDGLGWFHFLSKLGLGGCLADDMGLGKTVQVLALLESRRLQARKAPGGPRSSLVVAPRSLVFNWIDEAARFAPSLKVLDYTGTDRASRREEAGVVDLLVTTYGTLRRDAVQLADETFDYVVLDEATAIKNSTSQAAKAARLLRGEHRLALSGTPVENHVGELWSLFEFLNPGMMGRSTMFKRLCAQDHSREGSQDGSRDSLAELARALRPFFLRRTKEEVLDDLPSKSEQVVMCELSRKERKRYDELRAHYRTSLLGDSEGGDSDGGGGLGRKKIQVLEALLRLRQAACHPGLVDPALRGEDSAKLEVLLSRLTELIDEQHKILVFSQFTSLLGIVRERLDAARVPYEYLDGRTRDRKKRVEAFQSDPDCRVFLISLKAGGHGLNLTASDYVFLLDPWWNPAVESQAIDRSHRIGQTRPVFAYRLIAKDTVEQRVLELQERKRELAATILGEGTGVLKGMTRADLEALLS
ncbi:MAG: DEAD/DEAH box helicase [bacterium]|nr:DEAD/DEAH box helicase [bacterium]